MTNNQNDKINALFTSLETESKFADHVCKREMEVGGEDPMQAAYGRVFEEQLHKVAVIQKQIIRALFAAGEGFEVLDHIEVGTFPPFAIQAAFNRL